MGACPMRRLGANPEEALQAYGGLERFLFVNLKGYVLDIK